MLHHNNILSLFLLFLHLNILFQFLINHFYYILLIFHLIFLHLNILLQTLIPHKNNILFLFHFFPHLNIVLQILIYLKNNILLLFQSIFFHLKILLHILILNIPFPFLNSFKNSPSNTIPQIPYSFSFPCLLHLYILLQILIRHNYIFFLFHFFSPFKYSLSNNKWPYLLYSFSFPFP